MLVLIMSQITIDRPIRILLVLLDGFLFAFTFFVGLHLSIIEGQTLQNFLIAPLLLKDPFFFSSFDFALVSLLFVDFLLFLELLHLPILLLLVSSIFGLFILLQSLLPILKQLNNEFGLNVCDFFHFVELGG